MVQQDNTGENKKSYAQSDQAIWKFYIQFEYTAKDTPQQNHLAELDFTASAARVRAMISHANINCESCLFFMQKAFKIAKTLGNIIFIKIDGDLKTRYEHIGEKSQIQQTASYVW